MIRADRREDCRVLAFAAERIGQRSRPSRRQSAHRLHCRRARGGGRAADDTRRAVRREGRGTGTLLGARALPHPSGARVPPVASLFLISFSISTTSTMYCACVAALQSMYCTTV